ncbi:hypothetical protein [Jannaschia sp. W003]|uniref:hypothetical protein n=1 Tax=Jannaschia sp. W003 TaxID=2867012 RepID=UPI0021A7B747|nr:hypothetical protein [Jannaschia sp. W003]UWQ20568.1 hypothetical protein K3554_11295 [Jannaschia sp. W003]
MLPSLLAALALVLVHWITPQLRFLSNRPRSRWLSFAGGASIAYVFLHLLPEIAEGHELLVEETGEAPLGGFGIWLVSLGALLAFYGVERAVQSRELRADAEKDHESHPGVYRVHLASFALYNLVTGYLLVDRGAGEHGLLPLVTYAVAMALHLLITDFGLLEAFRAGYLRHGRPILSAAVLLGWGIGAATEVPELWIALVMAALGGSVILNVLKEELPKERESRFSALLLGAAAFALLLWLEG